MAGGGYRALLCRVCFQPPVKLVHDGGESCEAEVIHVKSEEQEMAGQLIPSTTVFEDMCLSLRINKRKPMTSSPINSR